MDGQAIFVSTTVHVYIVCLNVNKVHYCENLPITKLCMGNKEWICLILIAKLDDDEELKVT